GDQEWRVRRHATLRRRDRKTGPIRRRRPGNGVELRHRSPAVAEQPEPVTLFRRQRTVSHEQPVAAHWHPLFVVFCFTVSAPSLPGRGNRFPRSIAQRGNIIRDPYRGGNMAFERPPLPYDYSAREPTIDAATMKRHHDMHHAAY